MHGDEALHLPYLHADGALLLVLQAAHGGSGVVDGVAEQAVDLRLVHKAQQGAVCHAVERDALAAAGEALFTEDDVERAVAGIDGGVVEGDGVGHFGDGRFVDEVGAADGADLLLQIVTLDVHQLHRALARLVLFAGAAQRFVHEIQLRFHPVPAQNAEQRVDDEQAAGGVVGVEQDDEVAVGGAVDDGGVDDHGEEDGKAADDEQGQTPQAQVFFFADAPGEKEVEQVVGKVVDHEGEDEAERLVDGQKMLGEHLFGVNAVDVGVEPRKQQHAVADAVAEVLHRVGDGHAEEQAERRHLEAEKAAGEGEGEQQQEDEREADGALRLPREQGGAGEAEGRRQAPAQPEEAAAAQAEGKQRFGDEQLHHEDDFVKGEITDHEGSLAQTVGERPFKGGAPRVADEQLVFADDGIVALDSADGAKIDQVTLVAAHEQRVGEQLFRTL